MNFMLHLILSCDEAGLSDKAEKAQVQEQDESDKESRFGKAQQSAECLPASRFLETDLPARTGLERRVKRVGVKSLLVGSVLEYPASRIRR